MKQNFVTFYSPGTVSAVSTTKPIKSWDVDTAVTMSKTIKERYGALPYGFQFSTRERGRKDLDSHETKRSPMYYLDGKVLTLEQVKARNDPTDSILISNMECNCFNKVIINTNSWKWTQPFEPGDIVLHID